MITNADLHDSRVMGDIPYEAGALYIFDRAYMDTEQLFKIHKKQAFFVVREKHKMKFKIVMGSYYGNSTSSVLADDKIVFAGYKTKKQYPEAIRRIVYYDKEGNRTFVFYTNNFSLSAENIALAYKYRWRVELFFRWCKQHLHIKEFYGTSENVVKIQIYSAIIAYCLVAVAERKMKLNMDIYDVLRILSISLFEKCPILDLFVEQPSKENLQNDRQLSLKFF